MIGLPRCLGYNFDFETNQMTVNDEEAKIVRYIFDRYCEGLGGQVIARELSEMGIPSPRGNSEWRDSTILKIIKMKNMLEMLSWEKPLQLILYQNVDWKI